MIKRRTLITTGLVGGAALALAAWLPRSEPGTDPTGTTSQAPLSPEAAELFGALAPVVIGSSCITPQDRQRAVEGVGIAIARLSPAAQAEVGELVMLLSLAPARGVLAGVWSSWAQADPAALSAFLQRWRHSRLSLLQSGYHALHDLILGAWYADPRSWPAMGYAGPPQIGVPQSERLAS